MNKPVITREQAEAIEKNIDIHGADEVVDIHCLLQKNSYKWAESYAALNDLEMWKLAKAVYIGYEVEPEYSVKDWVVMKDGTVGQIYMESHSESMVHLDIYEQHKEDNVVTVARGVNVNDIERHATPSEIAEEKERRWWAKLDRGNDEYRMTDVVQHKDYKGLYEVVDVYDTKNVEITDDFCDTSLTTTVDKLKLVCPAEKRLDVKTNE